METTCHTSRVRPTIRAVLASPPLRDGRPEVLAGQERLDLGVRWVHVSDIRDVADLLEGGELILSTGLAMSGEEADAVAYLTELVDAGAAGLVVELGPRFPRVPAAVVARARAGTFPLVALHARVRFVEVTEHVHRLIVAEQYEQVAFSGQVHETFTRLSLENADAATIVATTADLCGSSVLLEDLTRSVLAYAALGRPAAGLLAAWETRSRAAPVLESTGLTGPEGWLTTPVGGLGNRWGRLVVPNAQASQARLALVLERAAQALELGRMVERDRVGLRLQAQGGLLGDLAAGRVADAGTAAARAASLGLATAPSYVAVVAHVGAASEDPLAEHGVGRDLTERLAASVTAAGLSGLVGPLSTGTAGQQVGVLLAVPATRGRPRDVAGDLARALGDPGVTLGAADPATSVLAAGASLRAAAHVAEVAAAMPGPRRDCYRRSDVRLYGLVALLHEDPRVQAFVEAELSPLLEHEARRAGGLLDLLRQYVAAGGNKSRLASTSHRSRPAVYKKLAQLERILGVDLDDPASLMSVGVALMAYDVGRPAGAPTARP